MSSPLHVVRQVLGRSLPVRDRRWELRLVGPDPEAAVSEDDTGIIAGLEVVAYDAETAGNVQDLGQQSLLVVEAAQLATGLERIEAFLVGSLLAVPILLDRHGEALPMPADLLCPPALRDADACTAEAFRDLVLQPEGPWQRWARERHGLYYLDAGTYAAFLTSVDQPPLDELVRRRDEALARMQQRTPAVAARLRATHGLELPAGAAVMAAFFEALTPAERDACTELASQLWRPCGVLEWFEDGGLDRPITGGPSPAREGLDARLLWRYQSNPPEFVPILRRYDGVHEFLGYFYDDPEQLPAGVAMRQPRDAGETWWYAPSPLAAVRQKLEDLHASTYDAQGTCQLQLLRDALARFEAAERDALAADTAGAPMTYETRAACPGTVCGIGPIGPDGERPAAPYLAELEGEPERFPDPPRIYRWIDDARAALAAGAPLEALALARDLHLFNGNPALEDALRAAALELMTGAYRALDREALAAIAEVHYADRYTVACLGPAPIGAARNQG